MPTELSLPEQKRIMESRIIDVLRTIYDPEIPVNIYELGLVYEINISDAMAVKINMTLTAPNCPVAEDLPIEVRDRVLAISGVTEAKVDIVFDPPWSTDRISESAMLDLGLL